MLPKERRQKLLDWLREEENLTVTEVSKRLNVSEMTVYRDIKPLLEDKKIVKTSSGLSLSHLQVSTSGCTYCFKEANNRHPVQIITKDLKVEQLCCPHCGLLRYKAIENNVSQIICRDFLSDTTISAKMAYFLFDADFNLNCCQPQVLTFESITNAEKFQKGFGGTVLQFNEAVVELLNRMSGKGCVCTNGRH